ncbi:unnamed protein product [Rotaria socialis]|uniref:Multifunctional fusion protein n=2 Tax=Rotaria socialis TaxID=392032 RepID=A0A820VYR9_9BILA|nr:unnamed protein product [Rotaria socialis]
MTELNTRIVVQNCLLVWLDPSLDETKDHVRDALTLFSAIINPVHIFTDSDQCIDFLTEIKDAKVFMIISDSLRENIIPLIHNMPQLYSIFILCNDKLCPDNWIQSWSKVKGAFDQIYQICDIVRRLTKKCEHDMTPMSFIAVNDNDPASLSIQHINQLDPTFMYTQIFKKVLLEIDDKDDDKAIKFFTAYCRQIYSDNSVQLKNITKFESEFQLYKPIWWYTSEYFLYSMLNRALRTLDVNIMLKMGFFIRFLHRHIEQLYQEQSTDFEQHFTVYRGQCLSKMDFEKLLKTIGGLMSFNNFLSTSRDKNVSMAFADSDPMNLDSIGILFIMSIEPKMSKSPFALIDKVSQFDSEEEILFSMHTVFRIVEIEKVSKSSLMWRVHLILTADDDPHLAVLTKYMQEESNGSTGWERMGHLMHTLGESEKGEEVYTMLIEQASNEKDTANYYHHLGVMKDRRGEYREAIRFYEQSIAIQERTKDPNHKRLETSYHNLGLAYNNMGEYSKALSFYEKALYMEKKILPENHPSLATSYNNIGLLYDNMGEYSKALSFYENSLDIYQKTLPPNHPLLATLHSNIGVLFTNLGEYSKALSFYEKALDIEKKVLPTNHPDLATSYNNIGSVYKSMGEYSKALVFYEKDLEINQRILSPNHSDLAISYNNIGGVYDNMGEYLKALLFYKKAFDIYKRNLPPTHPNVGMSYGNLGGIYYKIQEYTKALKLYEKNLEIFQMSLPPTHPHIAACKRNIEAVKKKI